LEYNVKQKGDKLFIRNVVLELTPIAAAVLNGVFFQGPEWQQEPKFEASQIVGIAKVFAVLYKG
jgi:hypothetical protein